MPAGPLGLRLCQGPRGEGDSPGRHPLMLRVGAGHGERFGMGELPFNLESHQSRGKNRASGGKLMAWARPGSCGKIPERV